MSTTDPLSRITDPAANPTADDYRTLAAEILDGLSTPARIGAALAALRARGEAGEVLAAFSAELFHRAVTFPKGDGPGILADTCGTGGDGSGTFNISTTAALIVAAAGVPVVKHGNRAASSRCGSADVLERLGLSMDRTPGQAAELLRRHRFCFLFAPAWHPALRPLAPIRRELGFRTVFNFLGPLVNPADPHVQLVGVCDEHMLVPMAEALRARGRRRALVVHASDGLDEITLTGATAGILLEGDTLLPWSLEPESIGMEIVTPESLRTTSVDDNVAIIEEILRGGGGPCAEVANLNAGAVLWLAGECPDMRTGLARAREVQRSGAPWRLLREVVEGQ